MAHSNHLSRRRLLLSAAAAATASGSSLAPAPYGALPSRRQMTWHEREVYGFLHFTVNTFTDREWGLGDEDPSIFHPTAFDADALVSGLKAGGLRGLILTCKHHDGFCLWPTETTAHSVRGSGWRGGKGDVVKEISEAARRQGVPFGVYLSPWDRNNAAYGKPEYIGIYRQQLTELLTRYGPIFEVWFDGANGGDGYYGGAREKRLIDKKTYYEWPKTWELVRSLQPEAVIFSDVGPDIRWVGNERGYANDTCWETYAPKAPDGGIPAPGHVLDAEGQTGTRNAGKWLPPECDVSIRPGWFWHEKENGQVKTPQQLMELYYRSAGRGGSMLLNIPPDRRGLLSDPDLASLRAFGGMLRKTFRENLAAGASVTASNVRGRRKEFDASRLLDGDRNSYWATDDAITTAEVVFTLRRKTAFDVIRLREAISLGQRVDAFALDFRKNDEWTDLAKGTSIGACRLIRLQERIETDQVRLRITQASACPALSELGLFLEDS